MMEIPPELLAPPPRPLPAWIRRSRTGGLTLAFALLFAVMAGAMVSDAGWGAAIPLGVAAVLGAAGSDILRARALLRKADGAATGRVIGTEPGWFRAERAMITVSWEFESPRGRSTGSSGFARGDLVRTFGFLPRVGDVVFVAYDRSDPRRNGAWGFAASPDLPAPHVGFLDREAPRWLQWAVRAVGLAFGLLFLSSMLYVLSR